MKTLSQFSLEQTETKIQTKNKAVTLRDGGSQLYDVVNTEDCGFCAVIQDFSIGSKRTGKEGSWLGMLPPPNHTGDKHVPISCSDIEFVN